LSDERQTVADEVGTMFIKIERRFSVASAQMLRAALTLGAPFQRVSIDFSDARVIDDAALRVLAEILSVHAPSHVELHGLSRLQQRVVRDMGGAIAA
jgi:anti-anti-sigma regulatory factor